MRRYLTTILFVFLFNLVMPQSKIGVISDIDGYTNIRALGNNQSQVIGKIYTGEKFSYFPSKKSNWWFIHHGNTIGFIHNSRISFLQNGFLKLNEEIIGSCEVVIKEHHLNDVLIQTIQIKTSDNDNYDMVCKPFIRTLKNNNQVELLYYPEIEPVGDDYGISFDQNQNIPNLFIASKFGDYYGNIILIDQLGKINFASGGNYFITKDNNYIVSNWASDLSGITIVDLSTKEVHQFDEMDFYLGSWYHKDGKYIVPLWNGSEETNEIYEINFNELTIVKSDLTIENSEKIQLAIKQDCYCN